MKRTLRYLTGVLLVLAGSILPAKAQWITQTISLRQGWNAVYLHVDASYASINNLVGAGAAQTTPITQIWLWQPKVATAQFITSPQAPTAANSQWVNWNRAADSSSALQRLSGNSACLVYATAAYVWNLKGVPVLPNYLWTSSGLNFIGFPTPPSGAPNFADFLAPAPSLLQNLEIYQYVGGELSAANPAQVFALRTTTVNRGQAYWMRSDDANNRYFGPFAITMGDSHDLRFGETRGTCGLRIKNVTSAALTVSLNLLASESAPGGGAIPSVPPLLIRGALNPANLVYAYTNLTQGSGQTWTLAPAGQMGSEAEIVLGLNRYAMTGTPGTTLAAILRLTDSLSFSRLDLPVSATIASSAGLWVGSASVSQVGEYLKTYQMDSAGTPILDSNGQYQIASINTNLGSVPSKYPLRLIVHNPTNGNAVLLQRVYCGLDAYSNTVISTRESALNSAHLSSARRISASHLPWSAANAGWSLGGQLGQGATLSASVVLGYNDQASNPFVHTYHPDHDNLDSTFSSVLPQGAESYSVKRNIALQVNAPPDNFLGLTSSGRSLTGTYQETITLSGLARSGGTNDTREFRVTGSFTLNRISTVPHLTAP